MAPFVTVSVSLTQAVAGWRASLTGEQADHLRRVLRMDPGDELCVSDGNGWIAAATLGEEGVVLEEDARFHPAPDPRLVVVHALPKGRKLDEVVRLLTELGVMRVVPVEADHSVVRLQGEKAERARRRWQSIADSAVDQSRRAWSADVATPAALASALEALSPACGIVARVGATRSVGDAIAAWRGSSGPLVVAVGPEGGWSADEVGQFETRGYRTISLGPTVLRTEHAAGVLTGIVNYVLGRMG